MWEYLVKGSHEYEASQTHECLYLQNLEHAIRSKLVSTCSFWRRHLC